MLFLEDYVIGRPIDLGNYFIVVIFFTHQYLQRIETLQSYPKLTKKTLNKNSNNTKYGDLTKHSQNKGWVTQWKSARSTFMVVRRCNILYKFV